MSTTETNTELIRRYLNAFNERDEDALSELLAEDVVEHEHTATRRSSRTSTHTSRRSRTTRGRPTS